MALTKADKEYLGAVLTPIAKDVKEVKHTVMGDPSDADDDGLSGMVKDNTRFRNNTVTGMKFLWTAVVGLITKIIYGEYK